MEGQLAQGFLRLPAADGPDRPDAAAAIEHGFGALPVGQGGRQGTGLPEGVAWRSSGHAALMRKERELRRQEQQRLRDRTGFEQLRQVWNQEVVLRNRDSVPSEDGASAQAAHPAAWSLEGLMRVGWREVGGGVRHQRGGNSINETRRSMDALVCLSRSVQTQQSKRLSAWLESLPFGGTLHVNRHFDATPLKLAFGGLDEEIRQGAKYLVDNPARPGKQMLVSWAEYKQRFPRSCPSHGTVEIMAHNASLHTQRGICVDSRAVHLAPNALAGVDASTTYSSVEAACEALSLPGLAAIAQRLRLITISEVPDNSTANIRKRAFCVSRLPRNVVASRHGCCVHLTQRVLNATLSMKSFVGDIHAVHIVTRSQSHRQLLSRALQQIINRELVVIPGQPPDPLWRAHTETVLSHTLLRAVDQTRGCLVNIPLPGVDWTEGGPEDGPNLRSFERRRAGAALLLKYFNGDIRSRQLIHYETGCCDDIEDARCKLHAAVMSSGRSLVARSLTSRAVCEVAICPVVSPSRHCIWIFWATRLMRGYGVIRHLSSGPS